MQIFEFSFESCILNFNDHIFEQYRIDINLLFRYLLVIIMKFLLSFIYH